MSKKNAMQEKVEKTEKAESQQTGEQMNLIDVGPKNLKKIAPHARKYKAAMNERVAALAIEVAEKQIIKDMVEESGLKRMPDGSYKFHCEGLKIEIIPQDEKIKIKEESGKD